MVEARKMTVFQQLTNEDGEIVSSGQNDVGQEMPDPTPMALPLGMSHHATLADMIQRMLRHQLMAQAATEEGFDTFEEGEDFDIEDDPLDPHTQYEKNFESSALMQNDITAMRKELLNTAQEATTTTPPGNTFQEEEIDDGERTGSNEGRSGPTDQRSRSSDQIRKGQPGSQSNADDARGVRQADRRDTGAQGKTRRS